MAKNDYLARQRVAQQTYFDIGEEMGLQKMWDFVTLALRDPEIMGKDVFGRQRLEKVYAKVKEYSDYYHTAFTSDSEADYIQEKMDAGLREVWGDDLHTFYERYPYLKKLGYDKPHKSWK